MQTFELELTGDWQEVLLGESAIAFDLVAEATIQVYLNEVATEPTSDGNPIRSWSNGWDFEAAGLEVNVQRIWVKGTGIIRGVRS